MKKFDYDEKDYALDDAVYAEFSVDGGIITVENLITALNVLVAIGQMSDVTAKDILAKYKKKPKETDDQN